MQTRFEVPFIDQDSPPAPGAPIGVNITNIRTNMADFSVRAASGVLRVGGPNQFNKDIVLSNESNRKSVYERWRIRANNTAESSGSEGTDFELRHYNDNGVYINTAMFVKRSTGNVAFGTVSSLSARVAATWSLNGNHGFYAKPGVDVGNGASFASSLTSVSGRVLDIRVDNDANARMAIFSDGKHEWGDGVTGRDTNLYRGGADVLKTDDTLHISANLRINTAVTGGGVGVMAMANASVVPASNPTAGGVLYVEAGALKYRGASGTVSIVAAA